MQFPIRINKYLAELGIASRRQADTLIADGAVYINNIPATIGQTISANDTVEVRKNNSFDFVYLAYHKPAGVLTFSNSEEDEDILKKLEKTYSVKGLAPVGRLDKASAGLILLTNDGRVTRKLFDQKQPQERTYLVEVDKRIFGAVFNNIEKGVKIEREHTKPAKVERISGTTFKLTITEGKKHQIKRMLAALGYQVKKLVRIRIATIELGDLKPNQYRTLRGNELKTFLDTLGIV